MSKYSNDLTRKYLALNLWPHKMCSAQLHSPFVLLILIRLVPFIVVVDIIFEFNYKNQVFRISQRKNDITFVIPLLSTYLKKKNHFLAENGSLDFVHREFGQSFVI